MADDKMELRSLIWARLGKGESPIVRRGRHLGAVLALTFVTVMGSGLISDLLMEPETEITREEVWIFVGFLLVINLLAYFVVRALLGRSYLWALPIAALLSIWVVFSRSVIEPVAGNLTEAVYIGAPLLLSWVIQKIIAKVSR